VVMGSHMLHLELGADVSGAARAHSLQAEDVDFEEIAGCQLKPSPVQSLMCSARFLQSPSFFCLGDSSCDTSDITYNNYSSDNRQYHGYLAVNIIQFHLLTILAQNQIPKRYTSDFPILLHQPPDAPRSLSKSKAGHTASHFLAAYYTVGPLQRMSPPPVAILQNLCLLASP